MIVILQNGDQSIRIVIRQRTQQYGIYDAEDRSVGPDTQCNREDGDEREGVRIEQLPYGVRKVLEHSCQRVEFMAGFANDTDATRKPIQLEPNQQLRRKTQASGVR